MTSSRPYRFLCRGHREFDFVWNWELNSSAIGHHYSLLARASTNDHCHATARMRRLMDIMHVENLRAVPPRRLYNNWMGYEDTGPTEEGYPSDSKLPYE